MNKLRFSLLILAAAMLVSIQAGADIPPPSVSACSGKKGGDACENMGIKGVCSVEQCSRHLPGPNGKIVKSTYDCTRCISLQEAEKKKKDGEKTDGDKKDEPTKNVPKPKKSSDAGVWTMPIALGTGAVFLGLLVARRFGKDD
ncbi:MAG: hypothetical protein ACI9OJ_003320 [Myxococcota bacterium]|jgi:hypothetical protein